MPDVILLLNLIPALHGVTKSAICADYRRNHPIYIVRVNKTKMQTGKILISAIVGTSAMTIFSYLVSESKNKNFREPEVVGKLIESLPKSPSKENSKIAGWVTHYSIGISFVAFYHELFKRTKIKPSVTSGALLGVASGLVGIAGWKGMFELHPNPPAKNLKPFFGHLMLAHVVFGVFSALTYKVTPAKKSETKAE